MILFPPAGTAPRVLRRELRRLERAAEAGRLPTPLVAIDQEGGEVKRLPALPPRRSPAELGAAGDPERAFAEGAATGRELARVGVNVDLAPVLDVPAGPDAFIASRAFGERADVVAELGLAFARGLEDGGVAATAKHFPGLGRAATNTDDAPATVAASRAELRPEVGVFGRAVADGVALVMVGHALYPALDRGRPASQSRRVIGGLLRDRLGFEGVVITDDLAAGALAGAGIGEGAAALGAARAGADLLLIASGDGRRAAGALRRGLRGGRLDRGAMLASCARTVALRERLASGSASP